MKFNQKFYLVPAGKYENLIKINSADTHDKTESINASELADPSQKLLEVDDGSDQAISLNKELDSESDQDSYSQNISRGVEKKLTKPPNKKDLVRTPKKKNSRSKTTNKTNSKLLFPPPGAPNFPDSGSETNEPPIKLKKSEKKTSKRQNKNKLNKTIKKWITLK